MSLLVWVHDHIVWLLLGVVPCAAAITWGLWLGRYQPAHAGGPVPERLWPLVGDPRAGSMQLADDQAWMWRGGQDELVHRSLNGPPLDWREVAHEGDWRDQTAAALAPAVLDSGAGGMEADVTSLASPAPDLSPAALYLAGLVVADHVAERAGVLLDEMGDDEDEWPPPDDEPEPEPVWTVAGRLVETSGEWLRRLERDAAPGWTYAGTVAV